MSTQAHILIIGKLNLAITRLEESRSVLIEAGELEDNNALTSAAETYRDAYGPVLDDIDTNVSELKENLQNAL